MKKIGIVLMLLVLVFSTAACRIKDEPQGLDGLDKEPSNQDVVVDPKPQGEKVEVTLYYPNKEYILTGNENLEKLIPVNREVILGQRPIEEVILMELQKSPEDEKLDTMLQNIKILSVEVVQNTAYVNISSEKLHGGSLQEMFVIDQIVYSLTELPEVTQVQFLVDGRKRETLMGHMSIEEPLTRTENNR